MYLIKEFIDTSRLEVPKINNENTSSRVSYLILASDQDLPYVKELIWDILIW